MAYLGFLLLANRALGNALAGPYQASLRNFGDF